MTLPKFSIYYVDGTRLDGGGEEDELVPLYFSKKWLEAPADGVLAIAVQDPKINRQPLDHQDFYYAFPANHHGKGTCGHAGSLGPYLRSLGIVKFGMWTHRDNYEDAKRRAMNDRDHIPGDCGQGILPDDISKED